MSYTDCNGAGGLITSAEDLSVRLLPTIPIVVISGHADSKYNYTHTHEQQGVSSTHTSIELCYHDLSGQSTRNTTYN